MHELFIHCEVLMCTRVQKKKLKLDSEDDNLDDDDHLDGPVAEHASGADDALDAEFLVAELEPDERDGATILYTHVLRHDLRSCLDCCQF